MTDDTETGEQKRQRVAENLRRLKQGEREGKVTRADIDEYLASEREEPATEIDPVGALAQTATDAATLGLAGLAEDTFTAKGNPETFRQTRDLRKANKRALGEMLAMPLGPSGIMVRPGTLAQLGGSILNPIQRLIGPASKVAGWGSRVLRSAPVNAAAEAGAQAVGENVGTSDDPSGLKTAVKRAPLAAAGAAILKAPAAVAKIGSRVTRGERPDRGVFKLDDEQAKLDEIQYGAAEGEAVTTPQITAALQSRFVAPHVKRLKDSGLYDDASDATLLMEAYKHMSGAQRRALKTTEGSADFFANLELELRKIGKGKDELIAASKAIDPATGKAGIPSLEKAIEGHRTLAGRIERFEEADEMAERLISGRAIKGGKLRTQSEEAYLRKVEKMTPDEAADALDAMMGRLRETPKFTRNLLGGFGTAGSIVGAPLGYARLRGVLSALEAKAGGMADSPLARRLSEGAEQVTPPFARVVGSRP